MKKELNMSLKILYVVITFVFFHSCENSDENGKLPIGNNKLTSKNLKSNKLTIIPKDGSKIILEAVKQKDGTFIIFDKKNNDSYLSRDFNFNSKGSKVSITISNDGVFMVNSNSKISNSPQKNNCECVFIDNNETIGAGPSIDCDPFQLLFLDVDGRIGIILDGVMLVADEIETCSLPSATVDCLLTEEPTGIYCID